jgi:hypothetical protein
MPGNPGADRERPTMRPPASGEPRAAEESAAAGPTTAERPVRLPTGRLLGAAWLASTLVAAAWFIAAVVLGWDAALRQTGPATSGVVALAATLQILGLRPWVARPLARWPFCAC